MTESVDLEAHAKEQAKLEKALQAAIDDHPGETASQKQIDRLNHAAEAISAHRAKVRVSGGPGVSGDVAVGSEQ